MIKNYLKLQPHQPQQINLINGIQLDPKVLEDVIHKYKLVVSSIQSQ